MTLPTQKERQQQRRNDWRRKGGKRLDLYIDAKLMTGLMPHILPYGGDTHPGLAVVALLEDCVKEWSKPE
jgi:hypothetical protein